MGKSKKEAAPERGAPRFITSAVVPVKRCDDSMFLHTHQADGEFEHGTFTVSSVVPGGAIVVSVEGKGAHEGKRCQFIVEMQDVVQRAVDLALDAFADKAVDVFVCDRCLGVGKLTFDTAGGWRDVCDKCGGEGHVPRDPPDPPAAA